MKIILSWRLIIFLKLKFGRVIMEKLIEIDGVQYTEAQIRRALAIERDVRSPNFVDMLLGKIKPSELASRVSERGDA